MFKSMEVTKDPHNGQWDVWITAHDDSRSHERFLEWQEEEAARYVQDVMDLMAREG